MIHKGIYMKLHDIDGKFLYLEEMNAQMFRNMYESQNDIYEPS